MVDIPTLEKARAAKKRIEDDKRLAKMLPELEKEAQQQAQQQQLAQHEQVLKSQFESLLADYRTALKGRNDTIEVLLKSLNSIIDDCKSFDSQCDNLMGIAKELANVQLRLYGSPLGWIDGQIIKGQAQELLKKEGCYPLGAIALDSGEGQQLMSVLKRYIRYVSQPKREFQPAVFNQVGPDGKARPTY